MAVPYGASCVVKLRVYEDRTQPGDRVLVYGSTSLGRWDRGRAIELNGEKFPTWEVDFEFRPEDIGNMIEYTYFVQRGDKVLWEVTPDRSLQLIGCPLYRADDFTAPDQKSSDLKSGLSVSMFHSLRAAQNEWVKEIEQEMKQSFTDINNRMASVIGQMGQLKDLHPTLARHQDALSSLEGAMAKNQNELAKNKELLQNCSERFEKQGKELNVLIQNCSETSQKQNKELNILNQKVQSLRLGVGSRPAPSEGKLDADLSKLSGRIAEIERRLKVEVLPLATVPAQFEPQPVELQPQPVGGNANVPTAQLDSEPAIDATDISAAQLEPQPAIDAARAAAMKLDLQPATIGFSIKPEADEDTSSTQGGFNGWPIPDRPKDAKSMELTLSQEELLWAARERQDSPAERNQLIKKIKLKLHPDKGGTDDAMKWLSAWLRMHLDWWFEPDVPPQDFIDKYQAEDRS